MRLEQQPAEAMLLPGGCLACKRVEEVSKSASWGPCTLNKVEQQEHCSTRSC